MEAITADTPRAVIIAGLLGGVLSMNFIDGLCFKQRAVSVVSGMVLAHYAAPLIAHVFSEDNFQPTIGFLIGLFGMSICAAIFRAIKRSDLWGLVKSKFGSPNPGGDQ